jgi:FkbM family methyltransferase
VRTRAARLVTRLSPERLRGRRALHVLQHGELTIAGGLGVGLRLSARHVPLFHAHAHALIRGNLEVPVQEALRRHLGPGAVFYDVGANMGFFSLIAARLVGEEGRVYALEPAAPNVEAVRANAAANGLGNVEVLELAAGAQSGRAAFVMVEDLIWARLASVGPHPLATGEVEVEVVRLDDLDLRPPDVVKIDVEGAELDVLAGMTETLRTHRPIVICEMHGKNEAFARVMDEAGYDCRSLEGPEPVGSAPPNARVIGRPRVSA